MESLLWQTTIERSVSWGLIPDEEGYVLYQHQKPVRAGNKILLEYIFRDRTGGIITLAGLSYVNVIAKLEGTAITTTLASFDVDRSTGRVYKEGFSFTSSGIWTVQFVAYDGAGVPIKGDPAKIKVAKNLDSINSGEELVY